MGIYKMGVCASEGELEFGYGGQDRITSMGWTESPTISMSLTKTAQ
jgi:hypothetical protein